MGESGADGYSLAAWHKSSDLTSSPVATFTLTQGKRHRWKANTEDVRAVEAPDESLRRAGAWYHADQVRVSVTFASGYQGQLHVYSLDWDSTSRRQTVTVDDGSGPESVVLDDPFNAGAWLSFDIDVDAGATVIVTADNNGGPNAVLSAITIGGATATVNDLAAAAEESRMKRKGKSTYRANGEAIKRRN